MPVQTELLEDRTLLTVFVVNTLEDVVADDGFLSLREAVIAANTNAGFTGTNETIAAGEADGDIITFDPSLAGGTIVLNDALGQLEILDDLIIDGEFNNITISGNNLIRIFTINTSDGAGDNQDVGLSNLTLTEGNTVGSLGNDGGAILISDGETVTLDTVTITDSTAAGNGGAIFAGNGTLTVINSQIGNEVIENDFWSNTGATTGEQVFAFVHDPNDLLGFGGTLTLLNDDGTVLEEPFDPVAAGVEVTQAGSVFYRVGDSFDEVTPYQIYTSVVDPANPIAEVEPNDTDLTATAITEDTLVTGELSTTADIDFFSITLGADDDTLVVMANFGGTDGLVDIIDTNGTTVLASGLFAGAEADAAIATGLTGGATYYVRITSGGGTTGTYAFVTKAVGPGDLVQESEPNNNTSSADVLTTSQFGEGNLNFTGGNQAVNGGGIFVSGGTLNLDFTAVNNNVATGANANQGGGGIYSLDGTVNIQNSSSVSFNSATGTSGSGGGIFVNGGSLTIEDSTVNENTANRAGGGLETRSVDSSVTVTITDSSFEDNVVNLAPGNGGGLHVTSPSTANATTVTITGGNFTGNSAGAEGGGVWNDVTGTMTINGVNINNNIASGDLADQGGGGVFNNGGTVIIQSNGSTATSITGNIADGTLGSGGGILNDGGTLTITGALIDGNSAVRAGGGIEVTTANNRDSIADLTNVTISNNVVGSNPGNGGGVHVTDLVSGNASTFTITGGSVTGNSASAEGGGLWNDVGGTMTIRGVSITGNIASGNAADQGGGGVFNNGGVVIIQNNIAVATVISNNIADGTLGSGGGILNDGGTLTITGATINANTAVRAGGGIETTTANNRDSIVTVTNTNITNNVTASSPGNGGGVHLTDAVGGNISTFSITGGSVSGNSASAEGGGLWNAVGSTMTINGTLIFNNVASGNSADQGGGGIFNDGGTVNILNTTGPTIILNNVANGSAGSGGGILNDGGTLNITGAILVGNTAVRAGGGIETTTVNGRDSIAVLTNVTIANNVTGSSPGNGGGVHLTDAVGGNTSTFTMTGGFVTGNSASAEGGGLWNAVGSTMNLDGVVIANNIASGNSADQGGGGVFNDGGIVNITSETGTTVISNNIANGSAGSGGGILNDGGTLNITGVQIDGNLAVRAGGGIEATTANGRDSIVTVSNTTITNNVTGPTPGNGGGVHVTDAVGGNLSTFTITNSTVTDNSASSEGGGLWNAVGGTMTVSNTTISGNTASGNSTNNGGGGVFNAGGNLSISQTTISNNVADGTSGQGGGLFNATGGSVEITQSTISGNFVVGGTGGGIFNREDLFVQNSTISGNVVNGNGGGVSTEGAGEVDILNSTITNNNAASGLGGGLSNDGSNVRLESTIIARNFLGGVALNDVNGPVLATSRFNLIGVDTGLTGITDGVENNQIGTAADPIDPLLGPLANNGGPTLTHALLPGSLAINAGSNPDALQFDQRGEGFARTIGPQTDIGAVEAQLSLTVAGGGPGENSVVIFDSASGALLATVIPYGVGFVSGIRTAVADVNGDGSLDLITGAGPGGGPHVKVFSGASNFQTEIFSFFAFDAAFLGGVFVAAANFNPLEDNNADIVVAADAGGGPHVLVFNGTDLSVRQSFFAYATGFTGGVRVATGDINGDGIPDIITGVGPGGGPHVRVFDGSLSQFTATPVDIGGPLGSFFAYDPGFTGGLFVASGDINGDGRDDIITGVGAGGGPHVKVFNGMDGSEFLSFFAYDPGFTGGVTVGSTQGPDADGIADIITGPGPGGGPHLKIFSGAGGVPTVILNVFAFDPSFTGGIFVSGGATSPQQGDPLQLSGGEIATDDLDALFADGDLLGSVLS